MHPHRYPAMVRYVRLVRFSFLILIGRFATLDAWSVSSFTPMHHLTIVVSTAAPSGGG